MPKITEMLRRTFKPEIFYYMPTQIEDPERKRLKIDSIIKK